MTTVQQTGDTRRRNIRLLLAYDGTAYLGWQVQPQGPTIQSVLQGALELVTGERLDVKGSGRTDAGVHALGQVANFFTAATIPADSFAHALNSVLPPAIAVLHSEEAPVDFDAQFTAVGKMYRYRVFNSRTRSPFEHHRSWHVTASLNMESMSTCCHIILGKKDFSSFRAAGCTAGSSIRNVTRMTITKCEDLLTFEIEADGFLRYMVRNIVGTVVEVGRGRFSTAELAKIVAACDRTGAGITAPPQGLYLVRVDYPQPAGNHIRDEPDAEPSGKAGVRNGCPPMSSKNT